jgi:branched-chain amino acid transport system ATP-binding protein
VFYGDAQALWDVSFDVPEKKLITMIGSNGAGK